MSLFSSLGQPSGPSAAVEIAPHRVSGATLEWRGGRATVTNYAVEPLAPGALTPSLTAANVHDRTAVAASLDRVLGRIGRPRRIALVVPDPVAKVSILKFEQVPERATDLDQLVRWQVRKSAPFPIEEAQVGYTAGRRTVEGCTFVVSVARRDVIEEYEGLCTAAGAHPGIVDLSTFNVVNAATAATHPSGDWLLVNTAADYVTIVVMREGEVIFFRNRSAADGTLADLVHQTAMYYVDRLNGSGFSRVILAGQGAESVDMRRSLEERLATTVQALDPSSVATLTDRISAGPALQEALAPLVGVLMSARGAAA